MSQKLTEIKKGQVGTGLLIEHDGYMSLESKENKVLKESIEKFESGDLNELPYPFVVSAVFQKYGIENANGRIYPEHVLKREAEKYQVAIKERRAYGELNHPESSVIDLGRICMNIVELHWIGKTLVGKIELPISQGFRKYGVVSTLADMVAQWLISDLKIGVSSRGLGTVSQMGGKIIVNDDYEIVCWDIVGDPSTPNAWITPEDNIPQQYIESTEKKETKNKLFEELDKFTDWLND
jgi:hypothetical protein